MNVSRVVVLGVALIAGVAAFFLMMNNSRQGGPVQIVEPVKEETVRVLIANRDIQRGERIALEDSDWISWPKKAVQESYVTDADAAARENLSGAVARTLIVKGEPIVEAKIVRPGDAGLMAAIIEPGMRAVTLKVKPETAAGGFILPGDHVDVLFTARRRSGTPKTTTLFNDVRVLAVNSVYSEDQEVPNIEGVTVTLEFSPENAEVFTNANAAGTVSLALRSVFKPEGDIPNKGKRKSDVTVIRYGRS